MKGVGFFIGGLLLDVVGFQPALWLMAGLLACVLAAGLALLPQNLGKSKPSKSIDEFFGKSRGVNLLAGARVFMFGARDVWFVVGVPVFLYTFDWTFLQVGTFLAVWTIAYGCVQAAAPRLVERSRDGMSKEVPAAQIWSIILVAIPVALSVLVGLNYGPRPDLVVVIGLGLFGVAFAINSSLHSYLILAYAGSAKTAEDVGFYYAANATGRLAGTLLSGLLYQISGLTGCLIGSAVMLWPAC